MKSKCTCCWRCGKNRKVKKNGALCAICCHEEYHGTVRPDMDGFWKFVQKGSVEQFDDNGNIVTVPAYKKLPKTTVLCCDLCMKQLEPAAAKATV